MTSDAKKGVWRTMSNNMIKGIRHLIFWFVILAAWQLLAWV
ncbi:MULTISPECIES: hypothetical protein [Paenibacillus]|nr:hypothetical protein [Paenibacillus sp. IHBB 10380]